MCCAIWYQLKNRKNTHERVLLLVVKLQACNFTKSNTPPWMFSRFVNCTNGTKSYKTSHISHRRCSKKKAVLKNLAIFAEKTPLFESLFDKVVDLQACDFIKKRLQHRCFPVNIATFLRTPILKNSCKRLLLNDSFVAILRLGCKFEIASATASL